FEAEPDVLREDDWIVEETNGAICVHEIGSGCHVDVLPKTIPVNEPEFNPVLARRLLYAYLRLQESAIVNVAIYGAGSHTQSLLRWGMPDSISIVGTVGSEEDFNPEQTFNAQNSAILLSSASFEADMLDDCRHRGIQNVIALYTDWPGDMWK